jgi:GNAT superfamily N-acetyltransferase
VLKAGEEESLRALFEAEYGATWRAKTSLDRYLGSTPWPAAVSVIEADGVIVGAQPSYDVPLLVAGTRRMCTILVDVVTHPRYRRRGIFSRVVDHAMTLSQHRGASLALTTPNKASYPGFQKKLDWRLLTTLDCWVRLLRPQAILERRLHVPPWLARILAPLVRLVAHGRLRMHAAAKPRLESGMPSRESLDALWHDTAPTTGVSQIRDAAWASWRFAPRVGETAYHFLAERDREQRLSGYVVVRLKEVSGLQACVLVDGLFGDADGVRQRRLLDAASDWALTEGAALTMAYVSSAGPWVGALSQAGFRRVPRPLDARPCHVCVRIHPHTSGTGILSDPSAWRLTLGDSDLV